MQKEKSSFFVTLSSSIRRLVIVVNYRLGALIHERERKCPYCKTVSLDTLGDHAVTVHGQGDIIMRHDRLRDKILSACSSVNLLPVSEQKT